ncbi:hypothetical protein DFQ27_008739 [Actinomortierella ambigua]|uniref:Uncharacterized protein n=1 Tax=Actinomortierella ambigua TaxID=1343610 RepID=A0A9P6UAB1_9FUNG|nr:hypothetical protein DFQ27_008739 [Actinomortierella ambigua]
MATKNHTRVDSKLSSDSSSSFAKEFLEDGPANQDDGGGEPQSYRSLGNLRRCAATRDLTSIGANVNYSARVQVRFMEGNPAFASNFQSWHLITVPFSDHNNTSSSIQVEVQNLDTVRRFKSSLCHLLFPNARQKKKLMVMDEDRWPETSLYRKRRQGAHGCNNSSSNNNSSTIVDNNNDCPLELIQDFEALYSFGLADGDDLILLLHNTDQDRRLTLVDDPVARWVESVRRQKEFEQVVA